MEVLRHLARGSGLARDAAIGATTLGAILLWIFLVNLAPFPLWYVSVAGLSSVGAGGVVVLGYIFGTELVRGARGWRKPARVVADPVPAMLWAGPEV